jgi:flagellar hook-basal body complex protein FliE
MQPISPFTVGGMPGGALPQQGLSAPPGGANGSFSSLVKGFLESTDQSQQAAQQSIQDAVRGEDVQLHDVVLQLAEADLALKLMMEVRNRLISAYQEISRMQI